MWVVPSYFLLPFDHFWFHLWVSCGLCLMFPLFWAYFSYFVCVTVFMVVVIDGSSWVIVSVQWEAITCWCNRIGVGRNGSGAWLVACISYFLWFVYIPASLFYIMLIADYGLLVVLSCVNYHGDLCKMTNQMDLCKRVISCLCKRAKRFRHDNILA